MSGALLKYVLREWLGIAKGSILGEELFSEVRKKFWDMGERKEGEVRQTEEKCFKNKIDSQIGCKWRNKRAVMDRKTHGFRNEI